MTSSQSCAGASPAAGGHSLAAPALLLVVGSLLAGSVILSKLAAGEGAPMLLYLALVLAGSGGALTLLAAGRGQLRHARRYVPYALGAGVFMALPSAMGYLTVARVGAGFISLGFAFPVLLTWLLAVALRMERPTIAPGLGVAAGLAGGLILALGKATGPGGDAPVAAILTASLIPLVLAFGNIYRTRFWPKGAPALPLAALTLIAGACWTLPAALWTEGGSPGALVPALPVLAVAILVVAGQTLLQFRLQDLAGPVYMSQIGLVAAVAGALIAVALFGEALPERFSLAATLIALGAGGFHRARRRRHA